MSAGAALSQRRIFLLGSLFLLACVLACTRRLSWSLTPGKDLHFSLRDGLLVIKRSRVFESLV
ncbi:hypothetical protein DPMN_032681 [Dreissena polymorpha]|uniref:Uncharacterized protein n=1 Tax=Dreissena polymorpha TaxID=45954 RepID=A0A9D4M281_DREPO|nr:hypothetical protein DPMN_032681 [Dreissena polymorpha]